MSTITSANSQLILSCPDVFPIDQPISGYAADDAFAQEAFDIAETRMGVDGILSAGYVPSPKPLEVTLQPDSPSLPVFYTLKAAIESAKETFPCTITVVLPSIGAVFVFNVAWAKNIQGMPSAKKVLDPIKLKFEAQDLQYAPI